MEKFFGPRQSGKTTRIIQLSAEKSIPIAVVNSSQRDLIMRMAENLKLTIPMPIIFGNLRGQEEILIDNLDYIARKLVTEKLGRTKVAGYTWGSDIL